MTKKTNIVKFNSIDLEVIKQNNDFYLTTTQIGRALGYSDPKDGILKIYNRNKELLDEYSGWDNLSTPQGGMQKTRIFNEEGVMLIAMKSNKPKAIEFQKWAVKVLKEYRYQTNMQPTQRQLTHSPQIIELRQHKEDLFIHSKTLAELFNCDEIEIIKQIQNIKNLREQHKNIFKSYKPAIKKITNGYVVNKEVALLLNVGNNTYSRYQKLHLLNTITNKKNKTLTDINRELRTSKNAMEDDIRFCVKEAKQMIENSLEPLFDEPKEAFGVQHNLILKMFKQIIVVINDKNKLSKAKIDNLNELIEMVKSMVIMYSKRFVGDIDQLFSLVMAVDSQLNQINRKVMVSTEVVANAIDFGNYLGDDYLINLTEEDVAVDRKEKVKKQIKGISYGN